MKYKTIATLLIFGTNLAFAYDSTANILVICPSSITCNYEEGTCDQSSDWLIESIGLYGAENEFIGTKKLNLSQIWGYKASGFNYNYGANLSKTPLYLVCYYLEPESRFPINLTRYVKKFVGTNWVLSGFGKQATSCPDISDPSQCAGEK